MSSPFYKLEEAEFVSFSFEAAELFVIRRSRICSKVTCRENVLLPYSCPCLWYEFCT